MRKNTAGCRRLVYWPALPFSVRPARAAGATCGTCSIATVLISVLTTPEIEPTPEELAEIRAKPHGLIAAVKEISHLPIIVDPSHGTGRWQMVPAMARAAIAAGADGLIIEVHPHPEVALSDGDQSLTPENFRKTMEEVRDIARFMGREA